MQQNDIYNIPLPRGLRPKKTKKDSERGTNYPGWIKTSDSSRGHKISTREDGSVIDSDLTYTLAASTFTFGALSCRYRELKF
jgi:hypothetical protein